MISMCNIAGYIGTHPAAPILIEMMRREEGWAGGHYTGIATLSEGEMHYAKLTGALEHLLQNTDAASLPGNAGILHSRSPSGGDDEWAHPFVGEQNGKPITAYVANGTIGIFKSQMQKAGILAAQLENEGYVFHSRTPGAVSHYPMLPDGACVHMSDVMAQLITSKIQKGNAADKAMNDSFCQLPSEIVGLLLSLAEPESIAWSRINMPMFIAFAPHGAYLCSTPQALPKDAGAPLLLPTCSGGRVYRDHFTAAPYAEPPAHVAPLSARLVSDAYILFEKTLLEGTRSMQELCKLLAPLLSGADCDQTDALIYHLLYSFQQEGRLITESRALPGSREGITAPHFFARLR